MAGSSTRLLTAPEGTDIEPHDRPDFTMMLDGKGVAVEVTQIFQEEGPRGSPEKAREVGTARTDGKTRVELRKDPVKVFGTELQRERRRCARPRGGSR
jgi:hypothetical protein